MYNWKFMWGLMLWCYSCARIAWNELLTLFDVCLLSLECVLCVSMSYSLLILCSTQFFFCSMGCHVWIVCPVRKSEKPPFVLVLFGAQYWFVLDLLLPHAVPLFDFCFVAFPCCAHFYSCANDSQGANAWMSHTVVLILRTYIRLWSAPILPKQMNWLLASCFLNSNVVFY